MRDDHKYGWYIYYNDEKVFTLKFIGCIQPVWVFEAVKLSNSISIEEIAQFRERVDNIHYENIHTGITVSDEDFNLFLYHPDGTVTIRDFRQ